MIEWHDVSLSENEIYFFFWVNKWGKRIQWNAEKKKKQLEM